MLTHFNPFQLNSIIIHMFLLNPEILCDMPRSHNDLIGFRVFLCRTYISNQIVIISYICNHAGKHSNHIILTLKNLFSKFRRMINLVNRFSSLVIYLYFLFFFISLTITMDNVLFEKSPGKYQ